ncbi:MAG: hypothetical protein AB7F98_01400, partial [Novosphingobium sp.]
MKSIISSLIISSSAIAMAVPAAAQDFDASRSAMAKHQAEMAELEWRGEVARQARPANGTAADAINARDAAEGPRNIRTLDSPSASQHAAIGNGSQLDDLVRRGEMAQAGRTPAPSGTAGDWLNARDAAEGPRNIRTLDSPSTTQHHTT